MSKNIMIALAVMTVAFVSSLTGYVMGTRADNKTSETIVGTRVSDNSEVYEEHIDVVGQNEKVSEKSVMKKYVLKEHDGSVALYIVNSDGSQTVYKTYDISVSSLPEADRVKFQDGIESESLSEALLMVEDYL